MLRDGQGLEVATDQPAAIAAIDRFVEQFLGYGTDAVAILKGVQADPGCVMANVHAASLNLFLESARAPALARPYLVAAAARADRATERERLHLAAASAWAQGRSDQAAELLGQVVRRWPRDVAAVKLAQYHCFNRGDLGTLLDLAEAAMPANLENPCMHGMLAFGLEQCHRLDEAEAAGRRATAMRRREPWAHHAVAHVMETQGRIDEGIAWMEGLAETWADCNSFMLTHNFWHLALFHLDGERPESVLDLYDRRIWGVYKDYSQDQINAVSLLWRLEMRGVDVGERWQDVAGHVAARGPEHVAPFHDLHYAYALARAGREAELAALLESMEAHAMMVAEPARPAWRDVALPAVRGVVAHARGEPGRAAELLQAAVPRLQEIGGSHAQRDLFVQCWLESCLASGRPDAVVETLRRRAALRPDVAVARRQLERAERGLAARPLRSSHA